jgi:sugar phosphate isomerase/epimerase
MCLVAPRQPEPAAQWRPAHTNTIMTPEIHMTTPYSLAHLTVLSLAPPQMVDVAARAGYDCVGLRLLPAVPGGAAYPLMHDPAALRETKARCSDTGIGVFDLEIVRLDAAFDARQYQAFLETGAELGAHAVLVAADDQDEVRLADSYAAFCAAALPFNLSADLEFMPWTAVKDLNSAVRVIDAAGNPANAGVLVDALHFGRSASTLDQLRSLPRRWLHYAQVCDAPAGIPATDAELIHTARSERLLAGEGGLELKQMLRALPCDLPLSIEIPNDRRAPALGPLEWARQALAAARAVQSSATAGAG